LNRKVSGMTSGWIARDNNTNNVAILLWKLCSRFQDLRVGAEVLTEVARYLESGMTSFLRVADDLQSVLGAEYSIHAA
jgi:hypothetical protein